MNKTAEQNTNEIPHKSRKKQIKFEYTKMENIDPDIIKKVREINTQDSSYLVLKESILKEGQHHPITVRLLTDDEKKESKYQKAIYGIIDGHHRFEILKKAGKKKIAITVSKYEIDNNKSKEENKKELEYKDIAMSLRMNESSIQMDKVKKGEIIYKLVKSTGKKVPEIGEEIFKIKGSRAYDYYTAYRKHIKEHTTSKPRENLFDKAILEDNFQTLIEQDIDNKDCERSVRQLHLIDVIQFHLKFLKKKLLENKEVKENYEELFCKSKKSSKVKNDADN